MFQIGVAHAFDKSRCLGTPGVSPWGASGAVPNAGRASSRPQRGARIGALPDWWLRHGRSVGVNPDIPHASARSVPCEPYHPSGCIAPPLVTSPVCSFPVNSPMIESVGTAGFNTPGSGSLAPVVLSPDAPHAAGDPSRSLWGGRKRHRPRARPCGGSTRRPGVSRRGPDRLTRPPPPPQRADAAPACGGNGAGWTGLWGARGVIKSPTPAGQGGCRLLPVVVTTPTPASSTPLPLLAPIHSRAIRGTDPFTDASEPFSWGRDGDGGRWEPFRAAPLDGPAGGADGTSPGEETLEFSQQCRGPLRVRIATPWSAIPAWMTE